MLAVITDPRVIWAFGFPIRDSALNWKKNMSPIFLGLTTVNKQPKRRSSGALDWLPVRRPAPAALSEYGPPAVPGTSVGGRHGALGMR